jgi:hypothetical protein
MESNRFFASNRYIGDVYVMNANGGSAKQLTFHSNDETILFNDDAMYYSGGLRMVCLITNNFRQVHSHKFTVFL